MQYIVTNIYFIVGRNSEKIDIKCIYNNNLTPLFISIWRIHCQQGIFVCWLPQVNPAKNGETGGAFGQSHPHLLIHHKYFFVPLLQQCVCFLCWISPHPTHFYSTVLYSTLQYITVYGNEQSRLREYCCNISSIWISVLFCSFIGKSNPVDSNNSLVIGLSPS